MRYREFPPGREAAEFIESIWWLEGSAPVQRVVPDGRAELILHLGEPFEVWTGAQWSRQPACFFTGQITGPLLLRPPGQSQVLGVRFRPEGLGRCLGTAEVEAGAAADGPLGRALARAWELSGAEARVSWVEQVLVEWSRRRGREDLLIREAVRRIEGAGGVADLGRVARDLNVSLRQLERRFQRMVGLPPKRFCRLRRFQQVFRSLEETGGQWAETALECGYYDQAHLVRDFRELAGQAPLALVQGGELARHFLLAEKMSGFSKTRGAGRE
jgi:AraC-like DNA-binding protein